MPSDFPFFTSSADLPFCKPAFCICARGPATREVNGGPSEPKLFSFHVHGVSAAEFPFFPVAVQDYIFRNSISIWICPYQLAEAIELHVSGMLDQAGSTSPSIFLHSLIHGLCDKVNWIVDGSKQRWNLFLKITIILSPSHPRAISGYIPSLSSLLCATRLNAAELWRPRGWKYFWGLAWFLPWIFLLLPEGLHIFKHIKYDNFMSEPSRIQYMFMLLSLKKWFRVKKKKSIKHKHELDKGSSKEI